MEYSKAIIIVLIISIAGTLFSGYLSYYELFVPAGCSDAVISCGQNPVSIANLPACVYGFAMYLILFLVSLTTILSNRNKVQE